MARNKTYHTILSEAQADAVIEYWEASLVSSGKAKSLSSVIKYGINASVYTLFAELEKHDVHRYLNFNPSHLTPFAAISHFQDWCVAEAVKSFLMNHPTRPIPSQAKEIIDSVDACDLLKRFLLALRDEAGPRPGKKISSTGYVFVKTDDGFVVNKKIGGA